MMEVSIPPRMGNQEHPLLVIEEKVNGSVTFQIHNSDKNQRCKVGQYQVRCGLENRMFDAPSTDTGKMTLEVAENDCKIEARIHFGDFDTWSPWVTSQSPRQEAFGAEIDFLL